MTRPGWSQIANWSSTCCLSVGCTLQKIVTLPCYGFESNSGSSPERHVLHELPAGLFINRPDTSVLYGILDDPRYHRTPLLRNAKSCTQTAVSHGIALPTDAAEFANADRYSPISSGSASLCLNSSHSVSLGTPRSSSRSPKRYSVVRWTVMQTPFPASRSVHPPASRHSGAATS